MSNGLEYFKKVYDQVPDWVQKMHDYSPEVLDQYTGIRGHIMQDGPILSRMEKDVLIASMNAARLYNRSMIYHTKGAVDFGLTLPELVEYLLVAYLYKGKEALLIGMDAIAYALELNDITVNRLNMQNLDVEEILQTVSRWLKNEDTRFIEEILDVVKANDERLVKEKILQDGKVPASRKYLNMVGNFIVELRGQDAIPWIEKARDAGVKEAELADLGYICILTSGIPTWFEISDSLKRINDKVGGEKHE